MPRSINWNLAPFKNIQLNLGVNNFGPVSPRYDLYDHNPDIDKNLPAYQTVHELLRLGCHCTTRAGRSQLGC
ncbi:MAG: hypothetical protein R6U40_01295 [Desulfobacterales bacterium]